jgi:hypothetical protein
LEEGLKVLFNDNAFLSALLAIESKIDLELTFQAGHGIGGKYNFPLSLAAGTFTVDDMLWLSSQHLVDGFKRTWSHTTSGMTREGALSSGPATSHLGKKNSAMNKTASIVISIISTFCIPLHSVI